jgi:hypothetical protein
VRDKGRRILVQGSSWAKNIRPYPKITRSKKRAGSIAQVVKHLPSQLEALHSNPNTTINRKKMDHSMS